MTENEVRKELHKKYGENCKVNLAVQFVSDLINIRGAFYRNEFYINREKKWLQDFDGRSVQAALEKAGFMEQIVLNVTEDCNMRCKYCFLSEVYTNNHLRRCFKTE